MKLKYHFPILAFIIPTMIISTLMFVYKECPPLDQLIGFYACLISSTLTYYVGIKMVMNDKK